MSKRKQVEEASPGEPKFRLCTGQLFLTYPKCPAPPEVLLELCRTKGFVEKYLIAQEKHADGDFHLHAYIKYDKKIDTKDCRYFDLEYDGKQYHGKYEGVRSYSRCLNYCQKDGSYITNFYKLDSYHKAMDPDVSFDQALELIKEGHARDYFLNSDRIEQTLRKLKQPKLIILPKESFNGPDLDLSKPCFIYGPSGIGKTEFAKSHFTNPLYVKQIDQLRTLTSAHDGIVFDDISFTHWPSDQVIGLLDYFNHTVVHCRYHDAFIPAGMKRIFTHNNPVADVFFPPLISEEQKRGILRRLNVYNVTEQLYKQ